MAIAFHKNYNSPSQIVKLLQDRGLIIEDTTSVIKDLINIGYYRFSAYLYPFLATPKDAQIFKPQSKFETALSLPPVEPRRMTLPWITFAPTTKRFYFNLCIIKYFIDRISGRNDFTHRLQNLLTTYSMVDNRAMGFPQQWQNEPLWRD